MYYSTENTSLKTVVETERLELSERYGRVLKASQDVCIYGVPWAFQFFFFLPTFIYYFFMNLFALLFTGDFPLEPLSFRS